MANGGGELQVAILTGGRSSRMGVDKALLPWGDVQLIDRAIATARSLQVEPEVCIVGERVSYLGRGATVLPDDFPGVGPLGGIATALRHSHADRVLVLAVDMPTLSKQLLDAMIRHPFDYDALIPCAGGYQPLHAIYSRSCLPAIERQLRRGAYRVSDLFRNIKVGLLEEDWIRTYDPDLRSFENANTPSEYAQLRADADTNGDQPDAC